MMNKKRICIFLALILVFAAGIILVRLASAPEEDSQKEMVLIREDREEEEDAASTLPASGENREQRYYLVVEDGYLSVYYGADRTFYAYTDIRYDMLDEATRQQIQQGLSFTDERTLYDFLENHSS
ncbi:MAG: BofC C-terminal domain-containing protein [Lachnospiraceae bacterium]